LPALAYHTYREDDVEEGGIKIKKTIFFMKMAIFLGRRSEKRFKNYYFYSKSPLLDIGGFAKQGIKNIHIMQCNLAILKCLVSLF
jgi:hypothetical protein